MNTYEIHCEHACRNACAMLNKALAMETSLAGFYQQLNEECDYPDVKAFLADLMKERRRIIQTIEEKLDAMKVRGEILDDVMSSFDPAGC